MGLPSLSFGTLAVLSVCAAITGMGLFSSGFFLTRVELPTVSDAAPLCSARYSKVVLVLVDALRLDFITERPEFAGVRELGLGPGPTGAVFGFEADPPTVTAQRLKGLTTGSLPTFIDASANFASAEVGEDSWVAQLAAAGKASGRRTMFVGDDTWESLYPGAFDDAFPFPSFNVRDLHTVDNGVKAHLLPFITDSDPASWSLAVGHMLGVDHVGHTFGPDHPAMKAKLEETNAFLMDVAAAIDDDTLLVVMGDHGMTPDGNHGGATRLEVQAGLLLYSRMGVVSDSDSDADTDTDNTIPVVSQVDLVPTLAALTGTPIPFSSVGAAIPSLLYGPDSNPVSSTDVLLANAQQVRRYLDAYSKAAPGVGDALALDKEWASVTDQPTALSYLRAALSACRTMWTQFSVPAMTAGAGVLTVAACLPLPYIKRALTFLTSSRSSSAAVFVFIARLAMLLSNSYIVSEHESLHYLTSTLVVVLWVEGIATGGRVWRMTGYVLVALVCGRLTTSFPGNRLAPLSSTSLLGGLVGSFAGPVLVNVLARRWDVFSPSAVLWFGCMLLAGAMVPTSWILTARRPDSAASMNVPRLVYGLCGVGLVVAVYSSWRRNGLINRIHVFAGAQARSGILSTTMVLSSVFPTVVLLLGPGVVGVVLLGVAHVCGVLGVLHHSPTPAGVAPLAFVVLYSLLMSQYFHASGHDTQFSAVDWASAFVGFDTMHTVRSGFLVCVNTFASHILMCLALPFVVFVGLFPLKHRKGGAAVGRPLVPPSGGGGGGGGGGSAAESSAAVSGKPMEENVVPPATQLKLVLAVLIVLHTSVVAVSAWFTLSHRRHLMTWAIFAPKLVFEGVMAGVVYGMTGVGFVAMWWLWTRFPSE